MIQHNSNNQIQSLHKTHRVKQMMSLALSYYYRQSNPLLGLKFLKENTELNQLTEDFKFWWDKNSNSFTSEVERFLSIGIQFTYPGCADYPSKLLTHLEEPPLFLTYRGSPCWDSQICLSIVGSRKISSLTRDWMNEELMSFLMKHNVCVVSGGARGVDQHAHFCALRSKRKTLVFLPSGLEQIYPKELLNWTNDIINSEGAFISEYWPTDGMKKHYFIQRNRLIAAIADFVLVTQGENRSGTMLTAQWAINLGKSIGVVPGHPKEGLFSGNLNLLRMGVPPVIDSEDLSMYFF